MTKYYAYYLGSDIVLVFDSALERDIYVHHEKLVHPECMSVPEIEIRDLIEGKEPIYDKEFGCLTIRA